MLMQAYFRPDINAIVLAKFVRPRVSTPCPLLMHNHHEEGIRNTVNFAYMPICRKQQIAAEAFEAAGVWDVDGDGWLDIVSGGFWYPGPTFHRRHRIGDVARFGEYYDDFSAIPMDIAGDGRLDFVTG